MKKLAVLYFGQLRLNPRENENFDLLINKVKEEYQTDIYVHTWSVKENQKYKSSYWSSHLFDNLETSSFSDRLKYVSEVYNPISMKIELQRNFDHEICLHPETNRNRDYAPYPDNPENISMMLSQLYSIDAVCNLIPDATPKYDLYILVRHDFQYLTEKILEPQDDHEILQRADFINIFKFPALAIYQNLMKILREKKNTVFDFVNAPTLRQFPLKDAGFRFTETDLGCLVRKWKSDMTLENIDAQHYHTYFNNHGIYIRKALGKKHYFCRLVSANTKRPYRWIGDYIPEAGTHDIAFKVKFTNRVPSGSVYSKSHGPDKFFAAKPFILNEWQEIKINDLQTFRDNELFIYIFLDDYVGEDLDFELCF